MKLYVHPLSPPALGVLFTAEAMGLDYEKSVMNLASGEQRSPEYLAINPKGKVPVMNDGGFILSESAAIMRYLAKRENSPLYPDDAKAQARVEEWMDFIAHHIRTPYGRVQFNRMVAPMIGQPPDEKSIEQALMFLSQNLPFIETQLSQTPFLCGDEMSLADIALIAALDSSEAIKIDLSPYPVLSGWRSERRSEDFYTSVHSHFGAELGL